MAPQRTPDRSRSPPARAKPSGGSLLADADRGLIDGDPGMIQDAIHKERVWFASVGTEYRHRSLRTPVQHFRRASVSSVHRSAATGSFLIGQSPEDFEVHLGTRLYAGDFTGNLGPCQYSWKPPSGDCGTRAAPDPSVKKSEHKYSPLKYLTETLAHGLNRRRTTTSRIILYLLSENRSTSVMEPIQH